MLAKLIKHEFLASYRIYLPVYAALYLLSLLIYLTYKAGSDVYTLLLGVYLMLVGGMIFFLIYNLVVSLGSRVYGKPGYLLFSIPAKTHEIMLSKFIMNFLWVFVSLFVTVTSILVAFSLLGIYDELSAFMSLYWYELDLSASNVVLIVFYAILYVLYLISFFMFLFAILNIVYKGEKKILFGFLVYFGLNMVLNIVETAAYDIFEEFLTTTTSWLWYDIAVYAILSCVFVGFTYHSMNKKMELQ